MRLESFESHHCRVLEAAAMAATCAVLCTGIRGISLAAFDCKTSFAASRSFKFRLLSKGTLTKVSSRRGGIIRCTTSETDKSKVVEGEDGWIAANDGLVRSLPLFLGAGALVAVLLNRSFSGIAPVADSSRCRITMPELFSKFLLFWVSPAK